MGALIGLMFVCIVDFIFPPKHLQRKSFAQSSDAIANSNEEIPEDDLVDLSSSEVDEEDSRKQATPPSSPSKKKSKGKDEGDYILRAVIKSAYYGNCCFNGRI